MDFTEPLNFGQVAKGLGLRVLDVHAPGELAPAIKRALSYGAPCFMELVTPGEHELIPPVAEWQRLVKEVAEPIIYATEERGRSKKWYKNWFAPIE